MTTIHIATKRGLEDVAQALAEGEHDFGAAATAAGNMVLAWTGSDCPWFVAGPTACGELVADLRIVEEV